MTDWSRSTYFDMTSWNSFRYDSRTSVREVYDLPAKELPLHKGDVLTVGLVLPRANDPTALLSGSWGERQEALAKLDADKSLWKTYGADEQLYAETVAAVQAAGGKILSGYVSSAETRTVWADLDSSAFKALFGQDLHVLYRDEGDYVLYWNGTLDPGKLQLDGLTILKGMPPFTEDLAPGHSVTLNEGPQGVGNATEGKAPLVMPQTVADSYNFPIHDSEHVTTTIGLIEDDIGGALPHGRNIEKAFNAYLDSVNLRGNTSFYSVNFGKASSYDKIYAEERSLDIGVVGSINPSSRIGLYDGHSVFRSLQLAIFDHANDPGVLSNSFSETPRAAPDSPFATAWEELYVDAALGNLSVFSASGDGGSSNHVGNGLANVDLDTSSPYTTVVGGTSISTLDTAEQDDTLRDIVAAVKAGDLGILWALMAGGLTVVPTDATADTTLLETVWNQYVLEGNNIQNLYLNATSTGGVDQRQPVPGFQSDFGLEPSVDGFPDQIGRGLPDVSAMAGGNSYYFTPNGAITQGGLGGGTSAAAPLWAALFQQIGTIFEAQHLPRLGYANDLLYQADVISPGAFRDVEFGNNRSSFAEAGKNAPYVAINQQGELVHVKASGYGYDAHEGFDLASGLGTPNGELLTEALLAIAHKELFFDTPALLEQARNGWTAGADEVVTVQVRANDPVCGALWVGDDRFRFAVDSSETTERFAWTSRLAQQSLQEDVSPELLKLFEGASQGEAFQISLDELDRVGVRIGGHKALAPQGTLSTDFGFVDFQGDGTFLRIARNVAVAETEHARDDMDFTVNMRQLTGGKLKLQVYKVDDFSGTIDGIAPGEKGYAAAAEAHAYHTVAGKTKVMAPGNGAFASHEFVGADAGDLIAMRLFTHGKVYYGFEAANESVDGEKTSHLWNYGRNTWGFEAADGGGNHDFNDLVVGFDFIDYKDDLLIA